MIDTTRTRRAGFTMIELLICIVIVAMIATTLFDLYRRAEAQRWELEARAHLEGSARRAAESIRRDALNAAAIEIDTSPLAPHPRLALLQNDGQRVTYGIAPDGLMRVAAGEERIVAREVSAWTLEPLGTAGVSASIRHEQSDGVRRVRIERTVAAASRIVERTSRP